MTKFNLISEKRLNQIVPWIFWATFLVALGLSVFVPIFTDEVGWKIISSRIFLDEGKAISLYPQCSSAFLQTTPLWLRPARYLDGFIYGDLSPLLKVRLIGCVFFFVFVGLFIFLFKQLLKKEENNSTLNWLGYGVLAVTLFGVLPLGMVLNRPEPSLLISLLALLILPTLKSQSSLRAWMLGGSFCTITSIFFSQHPKSLFFFPVILLVAILLGPKFITKVVLVSFSLLITLFTYQWSSKATACPENNFVHQINSQVMVNPQLLLTDTKQAVKKLKTNGMRYKEYVYQTLFSETYQFEWLPPIKIPANPKRILNSILKNMILTWMGLIVLLVGFIIKNKKRWWENYSFHAALVLFIGLWGINCFQSTRHFYEAPLIIPVLLIILGLLLTVNKAYPPKVYLLIKAMSLGSLLISSLSVGFLIYYFLPAIRTEWIQGGYLPKQRYSVSAFNREVIQVRLENLASKCGILNDSALKHLVVDDLTYSFFGKTRAPFHSHYIMKWWGQDIGDKIKFLKEKKSAGIICNCRFLDEEILEMAIQEEGVCCVGRF